jgi:hypothetical protein
MPVAIDHPLVFQGSNHRRPSCVRPAGRYSQPTQLVEKPEQVAVVELARVRLMPIRHAGDLDVPDLRQEAA